MAEPTRESNARKKTDVLKRDLRQINVQNPKNKAIGYTTTVQKKSKYQRKTIGYFPTRLITKLTKKTETQTLVYTLRNAGKHTNNQINPLSKPTQKLELTR